MTGGLHAGELIILAARPSMGKTALALNIAQHVATRLNETVAVFSLEMSKESLLTRMLCSTARVDSQRFRAGYLNQEERRKLQAAAAQLVEAPLFIDDTAGSSLMEMHAGLRRLQQQRKVGLVVVDYLQLMSGRGRFENRNQEISTISRGMKLLSKELNVPMLVLSQLSRAPETRQGDHRPQLSDLRESGSIEQDADLVAFIFREEVYKRDREDLHGLAELLVVETAQRSDRQGGPGVPAPPHQVREPGGRSGRFTERGVIRSNPVTSATCGIQQARIPDRRTYVRPSRTTAGAPSPEQPLETRPE